MQRRLVNKQESEMAVFSKCRDLIKHTFVMTNNTKRFPKSMRFTLVNRMQDKVLNLYECILEANEIFPRNLSQKERRLELQRLALTYCKESLFYVDLSLEQGYINAQSAEHWTKLILNVKFLTAKWMKVDQQRF